MQHRAISFGVLAVLIAFLAVGLPAIVGAGSGQLSDSSACSAWSAANRTQRAAYAQLYVREHRALPTGATSPASVESAITGGCTAASAYDEADTVDVIQAIDGRY